MKNLRLPYEEVREKEFLDECHSIIGPVCEDFNITYAIEFRQDQSRYLELRFANGEQRAANRIPYTWLVDAGNPYLIVSQEVSGLIKYLTFHKMKL